MRKWITILIVALVCSSCAGPEGKVNTSKSFTSKWKLTNQSVKNHKSVCELNLNVDSDRYFGTKKATIKNRVSKYVKKSSFAFDGTHLIEFNLQKRSVSDPSKISGGEQYHYKPDELFTRLEVFWKMPSGAAWKTEPGGKVMGVETTKMTTGINVGQGYNIVQHYWVDTDRGLVLKAHFGVADPGSGELISGTEFECLELSLGSAGTPKEKAPSLDQTTKVEKFSWLLPVGKLE